MRIKSSSMFARLSSWVITLAVLLCFFLAVSQLSTDHSAQDKQQLEAALTQAAVACYAAEGTYPPSASYLEEHYGVQVDHQRYIIKYEVIASNLMPDITVLEVQP